MYYSIVVKGNRSELISYAIVLLLSTLSFRSVNNLIGTTVPLQSKYILSFNNEGVGILTALIFFVNFITISFINTRLPGKVRKIAFVSSYWVIALLLPLFFIANSITIYIYAALSGLLFGIINPNIINAASMEKDPRKIERLLSLYSTGLSISLIIGPLIETYFLKFYSYNIIYLLFIPLALVGAISSIFLKIEFSEEKKFNNKLSQRKGLFASIIANSTYNIPFIAIVGFMPIYAIDRFHVSSQLAYFSFIPFYTVSFITRLSMTLRPFRSLLYPLIISFSLTAIGILGLFVANSYLILLIFVLLLGIPHGSIFPMSTILISRTTKREERNKANSYFLAVNNMFFVIVPVILGLESIYIGLRFSFLSLIIPIVALSAIFFRMFRNESFVAASPQV